MSDLKDIVEQIEQTPSPRCWDAIASQLPAAGAAAGASTAAAGKAALGAGKITAIIASSAAAITISAVAITKLNTPETPAANGDTNPNEIVALDLADTLAPEDTLLLSEVIDIEEFETPNCPQEKQSVSKQNLSKTAENPKPNNSTPIAYNQPAPNTFTSAPIVSSNNTSSALAQNSNPKPEVKTESKNEKSEQKVQKNTTSSSEKSNSNNYRQENNAKDQETDEFTNSTPVVIEIPNIFTPNGDGVNDLFVIKGLEYCDNPALIVKNQQGKVVFQSRHYENNWDASGLPDGQYFYQFIYNINHTQQIRQGGLMIRR